MKIRQISVLRIIISQVIFWPIAHIIAAFVTGGISLMFTWIIQLVCLDLSLSQRAKFAEAQRQEMLEAIRGGHNLSQ